MTKRLCLVFVFAALIQSRGAQASPRLPANFFLAPKTSAIFADLVPPSDDCRARIAQLLCLVDPSTDGNESTPRPCIMGRDMSAGAAALQALYDNYPPALQKVFCTLGRIYVERNFIGTAWAGATPDGSQAILGIRETALLNEPPLSLSQWISWKEQLSFGGTSTGYSSRPDLVRVEGSMVLPPTTSDFLYFVIAHEFGHMLDFRYRVNRFDCQGKSKGDLCLAEKGSWSELSWIGQTKGYENSPSDPWGLMGATPNASGSFAHREELCFYACAATHGTPSLMRALYDSLDASSFLTTYSTTNPWDDFAESTAFYAGTTYAQLRYNVRLPDGSNYDLSDKYLHAPAFAAKRAWIERFFAQIP